MVDIACEVNEKGTHEKNEGNEVTNNCDLPLVLRINERIEIADETLPYNDDWNEPEQTGFDK